VASRGDGPGKRRAAVVRQREPGTRSVLTA
jgi:hypothetical protein